MGVAWHPVGTSWCHLAMVFPTSLSIEGVRWIEGLYLAVVQYFLGDSFFEVGPLVLPQLPIAYYDCLLRSA